MFWTIFLFKITYEQDLFYSAFIGSTLLNLEGWQIIGNNSPNPIYQCGPHSIIGGYQLFAEGVSATKFIKLPPHYRMKISFTLFILDTWDNEYFYLYADQIQLFKIRYGISGGQQDICGQTGNNRKDQIQQIESEFDHNGQTSYILLTTNLNDSATDESWGFRNFSIYLYQCLSGCKVCTQFDSLIQCQQWMEITSLFNQDIFDQFQYDSSLAIFNGATTKQQCAQIPILCGYDVCGRNTILELNLLLPFHTRMKIKLMYLKIDAWENTKRALLKVNGAIKWNKELSVVDQYLYGVCGGTSKEIFYNLELTFSHILTQTNIQILNNLDQEFADESFGIRDIEIYIQQSICGDQIIQEYEECDDGNLVPFDGCFDGCAICNKGKCISCLSGWIMKREISSCQLIKNYYIQYKYQQEECLSTNLKTCHLCKNGFLMNQITNQCQQTNYDGLINFEAIIKQICQPECEVCLQGECYKCQTGRKLISGLCLDPCKYLISEVQLIEECSCNIYCINCINGLCYHCQENYFVLENECIGNICGDLFVYGNEDCDDGNNIEYDGCFDCLFSCPQGFVNCYKGICITCQYGYYLIDDICSSICGGSIVSNKEQCEDGNQIEYDGCYECNYSCTLNCKICFDGQCQYCDEGFLLFLNLCSNFCGDGILTIQEQCDDGNQNNGDRCSNTCEIEENWLCSLDGNCQYVEYPLLITEFLKQENQSQYVKIRFSQYVKQEKNSNYKETIQLQILELDQSQYKIVTQDINAANYQSLTDVQYIFKIEILTNQQQQPILEIVLTEQLYNENQAPLLYLVDHFQLQSVYQLSEEELKYQIFFCNLAHIQSIHCLLYQACYQFQAIIYQFGEFQTYFKSNLIQNLQMSNTLNHQQYIFNQAKQYLCLQYLVDFLFYNIIAILCIFLTKNLMRSLSIMILIQTFQKA